MRAVRCDVCGAKAMIAAAKCPSCGHLFELRDGFGELPPLAYCSSCQSYYPESAGSCRWCGTQPERPPIDAKIWRGIGMGAAAVIGGVWLIQNAASKSAPPPRPKAAAVAAKAKTPPSTPLDSDLAMARAVVAANDSLATRPSADSVTSVGPTTVLADAAPKPEPPPKTDLAPQIQPASPKVDPVPSKSTAAKPVTTVAAAEKTIAKSQKRPASRWVRSVSRHWVIVRSGASKQSRIIASIGPNSRVELGESRGDWRRIRAKGIIGWVEPRSSFEVASVR
jgi:ribosomal protein L40E